MDDAAEPGFLLAIVSTYAPEVTFDAFQVRSTLQGLPKEYVFTVVRTWLRVHEDAYADTFPKANI